MLILDSEAGNYVVSEGKRYSYFAGNNYLGLSNNQLVKDASIRAIEKYGLNFSASRQTTGTSVIHIELVFILLSVCVLFGCKSYNPDMILMNGKIITVDKDFTIAEAVAIEKDKIIAVGSDAEIRKLAVSGTRTIDLRGKVVIPGLIDAHLHPESASVSEIDREIPDLHSINDLLDWIKTQVGVSNHGEWIIHPKLFFTRLNELRQPTLDELDRVAPDNPVFLNGSFGGMINTAAMKISGITEKTVHPGLILDKETGYLTGFIRASAFNLLKVPRERILSYDERLAALETMLKRYNRYAITGLCSGNGDFHNYKMYRDLHDQNRLTVRVFQHILLSPASDISLKMILDTLTSCKYATGFGDEWVKIGALKIYLDGGILTGTAFLREPWGDKAGNIFGIEDPSYRGIINYTREEVLSIAMTAAANNWKFTAHSTGGGGVDLLLDVYEEVNRKYPVKGRRFSIIHGNFFPPDAIKKMRDLDVSADMQAAWFYKDADAMRLILGEERIRSFHPYRSMLTAGIKINGGSDHMVKWDANTSVNPYNPFLAMWTMITRTTEKGTVILPDEAITREDALKMYTINNAYASFEESVKGSIEPGKLADLAVISDDILTCPADQIRNIESELTIVGGKIVYSSSSVYAQTANDHYGKARLLNKPDNGFRGIWYMNEPLQNEYKFKYSGGLGTYPANHYPFSVYVPEVNKTFFCYGGTDKLNSTLLHEVSFFDHATGEIARPTIVLDKATTDAHDNPVMQVDKDGFIWIFSTSHGTGRPSFIHRSSQPYDITEFERIAATKIVNGKEVPMDNFSYLQIYYDKDEGFLGLFTHYERLDLQLGVTNARVISWMTSMDGIHWSEWKDLAIIDEGSYQSSGQRGNRIGTSFNYHPHRQERRGLNYRTNLYCLITDDCGRTWKTVNGTKVSLPLTNVSNEALVHDYSAEGMNVYISDLNFDKKGNPVILYLTSKGPYSGPENDPRQWYTAWWSGKEWRINPVTTSGNNYDAGSIYTEENKRWRIIGSTETGPQPYNTGGEVAIWESSNKGKSWVKVKQLTNNSEYNHAYVRRPVNVNPGFYGFWADGHGRQLSVSRLYFCNKKGEMYRLPQEIKSENSKIFPVLFSPKNR